MCLLVVPAPAPAQSPSIDQYVERVPTAGGSRPSSAPKRARPTLPAAAQQRVQEQGGADAAALEAIATAPELGAPAPRDGRRGPGRDAAAGDERGQAPAAAAVEATFGGSGSMPLLLGGMVAAGVAIGGLALSRRRPSGD